MTPTDRTQPTARPSAPERERQAELEIVVELLQAHEQGDQRIARAELERNLTHFEPLTLNDAIVRLQQRGAVHVDGEQIAASNPTEQREQLDLLAGVVLHTLISANPNVLSVEEIAHACERDPSDYQQREEIELALRRLVIDGLAAPRDSRWTATRAAVRVHELSF